MKKLTPWLFFLLLVISLIPVFSPIVKASPLTWYVSPTGSDSASGNISHPFRTLQKACNVSSNGDTIYMRGGTYKPHSNTQITGKLGTSWLTIRNYPSETVIINGTNCPTTNLFNSCIEIKNSQYLRITGIEINRSKNGGIYLKGYPDAFIRIDNCSITNSSSFAIKVGQSGGGTSHITFEHNYVYNNFNNWSGTLMSQETLSFENVNIFSINHNTILNNRDENIDMKGGCKHGIVSYNVINNTGGHLIKAGFDYWGGPGIMIDACGLSNNISIFNNKIYGNSTGITLNTETTGHYEYIYIYNNVINITGLGGAPSYEGQGPLGLANTGFSTDVFHNIYIYSNTIKVGTNNIYNAFKVGHCIYNQLNANNLHKVYVVNNIFYGSSTSAGYALLEINKISPSNNVFIMNNNSFYRLTGTINIHWNGITYSSLTHPEKFGDEPVFTNPQFTNALNDFHLAYNSPCIDSGSNVLAPSFDYDGNSRPQGAGYDIGAFEASNTTNHPPNQPYKSTGPTTRVTGQQGTYWANGTDPDNDKIQYRFDWNASGSHTYSGWSSLVNSGTKLSMVHTWTKAGTYVVKVQSGDEHGATSVWSTGLTVNVST
jgi:hypothetical protein